MTELDGTMALPGGMVEAAARALHDHDRLEFPGEPPWNGLTDDDRDSYRHAVVAVLSAALAVHVPEHCQYGRVRAGGLVLPTAAEDWTHYRYVGPWREIGGGS